MMPQDLHTAKDADLRASLQALKRATMLAREIALETNTGIVVVRNNQIIRLSAQQLRRERQKDNIALDLFDGDA
ncbi:MULTISPECIES: hypothetical protein [Methylomicrobium]|uniref:Uncharacterized protein n=1 Tax=Methylomicrobium album BG8 TaxID=686340 RepID=H8GQQ4_METAL|nr:MULTISPECIES: hypothetical protein [Methylomicrobium]EIC31039.1 hypothetical protein Metal_3379 [Methylomicrobium album BG8]